MTKKDKTKEEFIEEIRLLQKRIAELEREYSERKKAEQIVEEALCLSTCIAEVPITSVCNSANKY